MGLNLDKRRLLIDRKIADNLIFLLTHKEASVMREAAAGIANILKSPDGMLLWMKFDSSRLTIDASGNHILLSMGKPRSMPLDRGLYESWGVIMDFGDVIEVSGDGLRLDDTYSICFWTVFPIPAIKLGFHTFFQKYDGYGGHLVIDDKMENIGVFDEYTGEFVKCEVPLKKLVNGWNHIALTVDNNKRKAIFYFNGD